MARRSSIARKKQGTGSGTVTAPAPRAASSARISPAVAKIVWSKAAGICAFPGCRKHLVVEAAAGDPSATVGELAHIVAHSGEGPRAEYSPPGGQIDGEQNLILMCPSDHTAIDKHPKTWTVETLVGIKEIHERWVRESLSTMSRTPIRARCSSRPCIAVCSA
jgi:hypothetical protein